MQGIMAMPIVLAALLGILPAAVPWWWTAAESRFGGTTAYADAVVLPDRPFVLLPFARAVSVAFDAEGQTFKITLPTTGLYGPWETVRVQYVVGQPRAVRLVQADALTWAVVFTGAWETFWAFILALGLRGLWLLWPYRRKGHGAAPAD